jgi:hypothetical protein
MIVESLTEFIADDEWNGTRISDFLHKIFGVAILGMRNIVRLSS